MKNQTTTENDPVWVPQFGTVVWVLPEGENSLEEIRTGVVIGSGTRDLKDEHGGSACECTTQIAIGPTPNPAQIVEMLNREVFRTRLDLLTHYSCKFWTRAVNAEELSSLWDKERSAEIARWKGTTDEGSGQVGVEPDMKISVIESKDGKFTASMSSLEFGVHCNCLSVSAEKEGDPLMVSCCHPDVLLAQRRCFGCGNPVTGKDEIFEGGFKVTQCETCCPSGNVSEKIPPTFKQTTEQAVQDEAYKAAVEKDWHNMTTDDLMLAYRRVLCDVMSELGLVFEENVPPQGRCDLIVEAIRAIRESKPGV
jgi:hypothetical protein